MIGKHSSSTVDGRTMPRVLVIISSIFTFSAVLADEVAWEGGITAIYQDSDDARADSELTASADIIATLEQERGAWLLYVEASSSPNSNGVSAFYPTVNGDAGSVLTTGGNGGIQVSEFDYTFFWKMIAPLCWV